MDWSSFIQGAFGGLLIGLSAVMLMVTLGRIAGISGMVSGLIFDRFTAESGIGNGCTSGHGVCGIARLSPRSMLATLVFLLTGVVTVYVVRLMTGHSL